MAQIEFGTHDTPLSVDFEDVDRIRQEKERQRHTFQENHRKKKMTKEERLQKMAKQLGVDYSQPETDELFQKTIDKLEQKNNKIEFEQRQIQKLQQLR